MEHAGPGWRRTLDLWYHIYIFPVQNVLKDLISFAFENPYSHSPAHNQGRMASGSGQPHLSATESMTCDSESTSDDMETDILEIPVVTCI